MAHVLRHEQCPECAKLGKDNSKDNLAIYSDGGEHCFSCNYHVFPDKIKQFLLKDSIVETKHAVVLPTDVEFSYPSKAQQWIEQYELSINTLLQHRVMWSQEKQYLIFPYYINQGLYAWQGRYFGPNKEHPKWVSYGKVHDFLYPLGKRTDTIICVEDIVSAIKLSKYQQTLPLFGSVISKKYLERIKFVASNLCIWLDPDKNKEALMFANQARMYYPSVSVILSKKDPKEHTYTELGEILDSKSIARYS